MREILKKLSPRFLIECYKTLRYLSITLLFYFFRILPIKKNRIVFMNVWGYGDNARYVAEELAKRKLGYDIIFICNQPQSQEAMESITLFKTNTFAAIRAMATARVWVQSNRMEAYIRKRKKQYYIQLWHGGLPLKKIEGDCEEYLGEKYIKRAKYDSKMTNLYISNGDFCTQMYKRAFFFDGKILEYGSPRLDSLLYSKAEKKTVNLPIKKGCKVALYAPTYRDSKDISIYQMDFHKICDTLSAKFDGEWCVIVRLHPLVHQQSSQLHFSERVLDGSNFRDMYELMQVCDVLITDFSNTMFEFALTHQPVLLYAKDLKDYQSERGFYFELSSLPFPIASNEEELKECIMNYDAKLEEQRVHDFFQTVGIKESGHASKKVVDVIERIAKISQANIKKSRGYD